METSSKILELSKKQKQAFNKIGGRLGDQAVAIVRNVFYPNWDKDVKEDKLRLSQPIYLYTLVRVTIQKLAIELSDPSNRPYVIVNDPKDNFRLFIGDDDNPNKKIEMADIKRAIERYREKGELTFSFDNEEMTRLCIQLNADNQNVITRFAEDLLQKARVFESTNDAEKLLCRKALASTENNG